VAVAPSHQNGMTKCVAVAPCHRNDMGSASNDDMNTAHASPMVDLHFDVHLHGIQCSWLQGPFPEDLQGRKWSHVI
jgi:hypothetical protein